MTPEEVARLCAMTVMLWPNADFGPRTPALWHGFLADVPREEAEAALRELAASGREFAPPIGVLLKTVSERKETLPEWDEAWEETLLLIRRFGSYRIPAVEDFSHPAIAAWAIPGWRELCAGPAPGTSGFGTHYAQQREAFKALAARGERHRRLALAGAPRRERTGLRRLDPLAALGMGDGDG